MSRRHAVVNHDFIRQRRYNAIGELQFASISTSQMPLRGMVAPTRCRFRQFGVEAYAGASVPAAGAQILAGRRVLAANSYYSSPGFELLSSFGIRGRGLIQLLRRSSTCCGTSRRGGAIWRLLCRCICLARRSSRWLSRNPRGRIRPQRQSAIVSGTWRWPDGAASRGHDVSWIERIADGGRRPMRGSAIMERSWTAVQTVPVDAIDPCDLIECLLHRIARRCRKACWVGEEIGGRIDGGRMNSASGTDVDGWRDAGSGIETCQRAVSNRRRPREGPVDPRMAARSESKAKADRA